MHTVPGNPEQGDSAGIIGRDRRGPGEDIALKSWKDTREKIQGRACWEK